MLCVDIENEEIENEEIENDEKLVTNVSHRFYV